MTEKTAPPQGAASSLRADEIGRQRLILLREMPERMALNALAFALATIFADTRIIVALWAINLVAEILGNLVHDRAGRSVASYGLALALTVIIEVAYVLAAGLAWHNPDPYSKAFAVGMIIMALMHLATVRSIHMPFGLAGLVGVAGTALSVNGMYWLQRGDVIGLAVSTTATFGCLGYTLTAMVSNHRLHRAAATNEAAARATDEAKSLFLAQMSHELRTPLNAIIGMGQAELEAASRRAPGTGTGTGTGSESGDRMALLVEQARNLAMILDDITDMNAISHGRLPLRPRTIRLTDDQRGFFARFLDQARQDGTQLTFQSLGICPGPIRIDAVRLQQCLGNLVTNARRHAPGAAIAITCQALPLPDGSGGTLQLEVQDDGPGISAAHREMVFQPFHKGHKGEPGSGLGLAIVRNIARRMGGDLVLLDADKGAKFRLTVSYETANTGTPVQDGAPDLSGRCVLVVDDIASNRLVAATYVRAMGARVIEAASGEAALAVLPVAEVDLVLLDINMPGLDGFQTTARARRLGGRLRVLPIVAMTADVMEDQVQAIYRAGFDGHIAKPILPEVLAAELRRLL